MVFISSMADTWEIDLRDLLARVCSSVRTALQSVMSYINHKQHGKLSVNFFVSYWKKNKMNFISLIQCLAIAQAWKMPSSDSPVVTIQTRSSNRAYRPTYRRLTGRQVKRSPNLPEGVKIIRPVPCRMVKTNGYRSFGSPFMRRSRRRC